MSKVLLVFVFCCVAVSTLIAEDIQIQQHNSITYATVNVWSGSDYHGIASFGEWEDAAVREQRYQILLGELRSLAPDVVFLQEANPVRRYSHRIAKDLDMDEIHQVCIAGLKIFGLGIPCGFQEGNAILAKKELKLAKTDDWKLSGSPGVYSDNFTFHTDETISALLGQIVYREKPLNLVCVHLSATPEYFPELEDSLLALAERDSLSAKEQKTLREKWNAGIQRREKETSLLLKKLAKLDPAIPVIMGGDLNSGPESLVLDKIRSDGSFLDSGAWMDSYPTWDPQNNANVAHSLLDHDARGKPNTAWENFGNAAASRPNRLDYVFLSDEFRPEDILDHRAILTEPVHGLFASDHYGVSGEVATDFPLANAPKLYDTLPRGKKIGWSALPIAMYDTDTGFGYGAKGYVRNVFQHNESFDLILFNSTRGERWYKLEFSLPDRELRQRKKYPLGLDLKLEYDKWIKASFFGVGGGSEFTDREYYTKEPFEILLTLTKPFNRYLNAQIGLRFKHVSVYNYSDIGQLCDLVWIQDSEKAWLSNLANISWDTRDSFINPSRGMILQYELESNYLQDFFQNDFDPNKSLEFAWGNGFHFTRNTVTAQYYTVLWYPKTVLALRLQGAYQFFGDNSAFHAMLPLGGGTTLRGYPQDRFLDNTIVLGNAEIRFPLWKGLGGILGFDAGGAADNPSALKLSKIASNPVLGLRYYMNDFVVRADVGFGSETTGFYFNFGHAF